MDLLIPKELEQKLKTSEDINLIVRTVIRDYNSILHDRKMYFFEEYTPHDIEKHLNDILKTSLGLMTKNTLSILSGEDIGIYVLAVLLHDIGMHIEYDTFIALVDGRYDVSLKESDCFNTRGKTWLTLWNEYILEAKILDAKARNSLYGNSDVFPERNIDIKNKDSIDGYHKKLIGEFIRRHHPRFAHEVALQGFIGKNGETIDFARDLDYNKRQIVGLIARSHGINIRDTFSYLRKNWSKVWKNPHNINIVFLMVLIRISDYLQIDASRLDSKVIKLRTINSPLSVLEHQKHSGIIDIQEDTDDSERIIIVAKPENVYVYNGLKKLFESIQMELDVSWAVLGEVYGSKVLTKQPKITLRRLYSNLDEQELLDELNYVAKEIRITQHENLAKLFIAPLYGDKPTFGVRELIQNSVDAVNERLKIGSSIFDTNIYVNIEKDDKNKYFFTIKDYGKGMTIEEISNYFLKVGASFINDIRWKTRFIDEIGNVLINRVGRFGVGVLASFLIGNKIEVTTRSIQDEKGYKFTVILDQNDIEIERNIDTCIGTTITIEINSDSLSGFKDSSSKRWYRWYNLPFPEIKYNAPDEFFDPNSMSQGDFIILPSENAEQDGYWVNGSYDNITYSWAYFPESSAERNFKRGRFENILSKTAYVNGFFISTLPYNSIGDIYHSLPALSLFDRYNKLQINLNRNSIFIPPMIIFNIFQQSIDDFIACLLCMPFDASEGVTTRLNYPGFSTKYASESIEAGKANKYILKILYSKNGYTTLASLMNTDKYDNYKVFDVIFNSNDVRYDWRRYDNNTVSTPYYYKIRLNNVLDDNPQMGFMNDTDFYCITRELDSVINDDDSLVKFSLIPSINTVRSIMDMEIIDKYDFINLIKNVSKNITVTKNKENLFLYKGINDLRILKEDILNIYTNPLGIKTISDRIYQLLGNDPVIPFSLKERVEKFPLAFYALKDYIFKYLQDK
ncbi:HD domain-containing protein [Siphonobacter curvatus]|uniref:HD-CE domain-containing protein n=1 Tax=Siphonobacter curvatus TaxID=2094562 RepID=A0A2S7IP67_9BACT|nr:ATP-binding protein [Siphonobacter curvatus]PQA59418.1 hypothetical protein C5O19_07135 [Siphonobacter curvatus]